MIVERLTHHSMAKRLKSLRLLKCANYCALRDSPEAFGSTLDEMLSVTRAQWIEQFHATFVACEQDADIGMARVSFANNDSAEAWLISMWVAPDFRGRRHQLSGVSSSNTCGNRSGADLEAALFQSFFA